MDISSFENQNKLLRTRFEADINEPHNKRKVIFDGPINVERYLKSPVKIAWLLKEAYQSEESNGEGGGWSFEDAFNKENLYSHTFKRPHKATWHPIIYASFSILNGLEWWDDIPYIRHKPQMCDVVRDIALLNVQKLPALYGTNTPYATIYNAYEKHYVLLHEQIQLLNADVLIFGSTFSLYKKNLDLGSSEPIFGHTKSCQSYIKDGKLYIDAYHPAQRKWKRSDYIDHIVEAVKYWQSYQHDMTS